MKRPELVWVGAKPYTVTYSNEKIRLKSADRQKGLLGNTDHCSLEIIIDDAPVEQVIRDTLLHEVLHCIWEDAGIRDMEMTEEDIVGCVSPRLVSVLRVNPELVEYLVASTDEPETEEPSADVGVVGETDF